MGILNVGRLLASASTAVYSPLSLFAAGEVGAWYDPSDLTTMFQDAAGTTPVTSVEQPVGLILDKSKGLAIGAEKVTNGTFDTDTAWTKMAGWTISGGAASTSNTAGTFNGISQNILTAGKWYKITFTVSSFASGSCVIGLGANYPITVTANGTYTCYGVASSGTFYVYAWSGGVFNVDNVSVVEVFGSHASQSTAASRPVLSARVNLLTHTEQFDNAAWLKNIGVLSVTANATTAPDGTLTADKIISTGAAEKSVYQSPNASTDTVSCYMKQAEWRYSFLRANSGTWINCFFDLQLGVVKSADAGWSNVSISAVGNGWYRCAATITRGVSTAVAFGMSSSGTSISDVGDNTSGIYMWGADVRATNTGVNLPAYQRVGAATDYDTTAFPLFLRFDGVDDSLATGSIDFSATDKMSVFAGLRKVSTSGVVAELSATVDTNNGSFLVYQNSSTQWLFTSKGTVGVFPTSSAVNAAPSSEVVSVLSSISGPSVIGRVNAAQVASSTASQGTGNYGTYPLYIGRRGGSSLPYNGNLYSLLVVGRATTSTEISNTETWVNRRTGAY